MCSFVSPSSHEFLVASDIYHHILSIFYHSLNPSGRSPFLQYFILHLCLNGHYLHTLLFHGHSLPAPSLLPLLSFSLPPFPFLFMNGVTPLDIRVYRNVDEYDLLGLGSLHAN